MVQYAETHHTSDDHQVRNLKTKEYRSYTLPWLATPGCSSPTSPLFPFSFAVLDLPPKAASAGSSSKSHPVAQACVNSTQKPARAKRPRTASCAAALPKASLMIIMRSLMAAIFPCEKYNTRIVHDRVNFWESLVCVKNCESNYHVSTTNLLTKSYLLQAKKQ